MKCNLLPLGYRQHHGLWQRPACLGLLLMLTVCLGAGLFFQYQLHREKAYYTDCLYPLQQQIRQGNEAIRRGQAQVERAAKERPAGPLSPSLMVALAGSKPEGLAVEKAGRPHRIRRSSGSGPCSSRASARRPLPG